MQDTRRPECRQQNRPGSKVAIVIKIAIACPLSERSLETSRHFSKFNNSITRPVSSTQPALSGHSAAHRGSGIRSTLSSTARLHYIYIDNARIKRRGAACYRCHIRTHARWRRCPRKYDFVTNDTRVRRHLNASLCATSCRHSSTSLLWLHVMSSLSSSQIARSLAYFPVPRGRLAISSFFDGTSSSLAPASINRRTPWDERPGIPGVHGSPSSRVALTSLGTGHFDVSMGAPQCLQTVDKRLVQLLRRSHDC